MDRLNINIMLNGEPIEPSVALEILQAAAGKKKARNGRRVLPTLDEVKEYVASRGNKIDPEAFWNWCETNGWKQANGNPIVKWKNAVITWERNDHGQKYREDQAIKDRNEHGPPDRKLQAMTARRQLISKFRKPEAADWTDERCIKTYIAECLPIQG